MTVTFTSIIKANDNENKIEFTSEVTLGENGEYKTFAFKEPQAGEHNLIEVSEDKVNIFAGHNTLNLSLGEKWLNEFMVPGMGNLFFETHLHYIEASEDLVDFEYSLHNQDQVKLGDYRIILKVNK